MESYFGGRSETRIRHEEVPVVQWPSHPQFDRRDRSNPGSLRNPRAASEAFVLRGQYRDSRRQYRQLFLGMFGRAIHGHGAGHGNIADDHHFRTGCCSLAWFTKIREGTGEVRMVRGRRRLLKISP